MTTKVPPKVLVLLQHLQKQHRGMLSDPKHKRVRSILATEIGIGASRIDQLIREGADRGLLEHDSRRRIGTSRIEVTELGRHVLDGINRPEKAPAPRVSPVVAKPLEAPTVTTSDFEDNYSCGAEDDLAEVDDVLDTRPASTNRRSRIDKDTEILELRAELGSVRVRLTSAERELKAARSFITEVRGSEIAIIIRKRDATLREIELLTKVHGETLNKFERVSQELEIERQRADNLRRALIAERERSSTLAEQVQMERERTISLQGSLTK